MEDRTTHQPDNRSGKGASRTKLRIGIIFGGKSREREISFAGGRTVFDNLDRRLFEPIPILVDSLHRLIRLRPALLYKGSIRDFLPSPEKLPTYTVPFQPYVENFAVPPPVPDSIGVELSIEALKASIDFAFLALHGTAGEDGSIQGLFEWLQIPYSGAGILGSALGIDKIKQKEVMEKGGYLVPTYTTVQADEECNADLIESIAAEVGFPCVVKNPVQGSSIGVNVCEKPEALSQALDNAFLRKRIRAHEWNAFSVHQKIQWLQALTDLRQSLGFPLYDSATHKIFISPDELLIYLNQSLENVPEICLIACDSPPQVLIEAYLQGREFSIIVIEDEQGTPFALSPTEIIKPGLVYDYRSKYLPGGAQKRTPMPLSPEQNALLTWNAGQLKRLLQIEVYARIDGILTEEGDFYLNDPNTTSGMLPGSFFFQQAAEIGLSPTEFLTYIIQVSLRQRTKVIFHAPVLINQLQQLQTQTLAETPLRIGVILGGDSFERHVSVESGRNIYEKLAASGKYAPQPYFLLNNTYLSNAQKEKLKIPIHENYSLWQLPIHLLLKDNADDIAHAIIESLENPKPESYFQNLKAKRTKVVGGGFAQKIFIPTHCSWLDLPAKIDFAFIGLHGRPGEDGVVQSILAELKIPYNGSQTATAALTIDKYQTNELLAQHGFRVPAHRLLAKADATPDALHKIVETLGFPLVAKPVDDGCSAAVKVIKNREELTAYCNLLFRAEQKSIDITEINLLNIRIGEEIPCKTAILFEKKIQALPGHRLLEITVGLFTTLDNHKNREYHILPPSETLMMGDILTLEEKFLAGEGQNITPARFSTNSVRNTELQNQIQAQIEAAAKLLNIEGYARIDAFAHIPDTGAPIVEFIEVNTLPGMTPATCIFHQAALVDLAPIAFIEKIIQYGLQAHN